MINLASIKSTTKTNTPVATCYITGSWVFTHSDNVSNKGYIYPDATIYNETISTPIFVKSVLNCSNIRISMFELYDQSSFERHLNDFNYDESLKLQEGDELTAIGYNQNGKQVYKLNVTSMNLINLKKNMNVILHDADMSWYFKLSSEIPAGMFLRNNENNYVGWSIGGKRAIHMSRFMDCVKVMKTQYKQDNISQYFWYQSADYMWENGERETLEKLNYDSNIRGIVITKIMNNSIIPKTGFLTGLQINEIQCDISRSGYCIIDNYIGNNSVRMSSIDEMLSLIKENDVVIFKYSDGDIKSKIKSSNEKRMVPTKVMIQDIITPEVYKANLDTIISFTGGTYTALNHDNLYRTYIVCNDQLCYKINGEEIKDDINELIYRDGIYQFTTIEEQKLTIPIKSLRSVNTPNIEDEKTDDGEDKKVIVVGGGSG